MDPNTQPQPQQIPTPPTAKRPATPFVIMGIALLVLAGMAFALWTVLNPTGKTRGRISRGSETEQLETRRLPAPTAADRNTAKNLTATELGDLGTLRDSMPRFARYSEDEVTANPSVPPYTVKPEALANIGAVEGAIGRKLTGAQTAALSKNGFFLSPAPNKLEDGNEQIDFEHNELVDEFLMDYKDIIGKPAPEDRRPENAVFITSDFLLHAYHVYVDRTFQYVEQTEFQPKLLMLSTLLLDRTQTEYARVADPAVKVSLERTMAFFAVPKIILETSGTTGSSSYASGPEEEQQRQTADDSSDTDAAVMKDAESYSGKLPPAVLANVKAELSLILKAASPALSPLYGSLRKNQMDDYTQFKPRSHYAKNSLLRSYWKAMIWFGRTGFLSASDDLTRDAIIQTYFLASTKDASALWENIYLPTVFFVGKSDDLTYYDYRKIIASVYGNTPKTESFADTGKLSAFKTEAARLPGPRIQSSIVAVGGGESKTDVLAQTRGFRFMGQRFIPDSYVFSSLTQGDEAPDKETGQKLPSTPTALMVMDILGSKRASSFLETWIKTEAPDSDRVIAKYRKALDSQFAALTKDDWTQNMYWTWLYTLRTLFSTYGSGYPSFMANTAWNDKDLRTALGSWTELRHDTLLYGKQSYAEMGGGYEPPTPPPVPKGYVEPNLAFLNRLIAMAKLTRDGLKDGGVLPVVQENKINELIDMFGFYRTIAVKELENKTISDADFEKLRTSVTSLNHALTPADPSLAYMESREARAGLIADVHTAATQSKQEILYEATGIPSIIYVAVKDANGERLTRGVAYSYYEFTRPLGERLSDQNWQEVVYERKSTFPMPAKPFWTEALDK